MGASARPLAEQGIALHGRLELGVWIPLREEAATVQLLLERGFVRSPPGIRVTTTAGSETYAG